MSDDKSSQHGPDSQTSSRAKDPTDPASAADTELFEPGNAAAVPQPTGQDVSDVVPVDMDAVETDPVSDVKPAETETPGAPSFRAPVLAGGARVPKPPKRRYSRPPAMLPGTKIDDFEIIRMLGRGAFGHVYLARQLSLDREVALKVSANRGSEGRTMARLEHAHIVQVFSEKVDEETDQRLLCMQLVPGVGLEKIIGALGQLTLQKSLIDSNSPVESDPPTFEPGWTGADLLAIIDRTASLPTALDPAALRDREALNEMDAIEATAWIGARLAEALYFAHHRGVLHRDVKPANILVSPYGRPMLADFNISAQQVADDDEMFGGTVAYMAPEHLDAFNPADVTPHDAVTERADMYSLGLVLQELLGGRIAAPMVDRHAGMVSMLRTLSDQRHEEPKCHEGVPGALKTLEQTICRCLAPQPEDRFAHCAEMADQLDGCRQLRQAERQLPRPTRLVSWIIRRPFFWFVWLVMLPQLVGSAVNISYNLSQVASGLTAVQQDIFWQVVTVYNAVVYPIAIALFAWVVLRARSRWLAMHGATLLPAGQVTAARRQALRLPLWVAGLTVCGWLPGGVLFPAMIEMQTETLSSNTWTHFIASFTLSGLIALAYALCGSQFVVQRALYPRMWDDVRHFAATTRKELAPMAARLGWMQRLAVTIPLLSLALLIVLADAESHRAFKFIATGLILLGWAGIQLAAHVTQRLTVTTAALTGAKN